MNSKFLFKFGLIAIIQIICLTQANCQDYNPNVDLNQLFANAKQEVLKNLELLKIALTDKEKPSSGSYHVYAVDAYQNKQSTSSGNNKNKPPTFLEEVNIATKASLIVAKKLLGPKADYDAIYRLRNYKAPSDFCPYEKVKPKCDPYYPYRTYDGSCNNLQNPWWGMINTPFKRYLGAAYADGLNEPRGSLEPGYGLPNSRDVACALHSDSNEIEPALTNMVMQWGQVVNHDITNFASNKDKGVPPCMKCLRNEKCISIPIVNNYTCNCINQMDHKCIELARSGASYGDVDCSLGPREQINRQTSFLDGSLVYGTSEDDVNKLKNPQNRRYLAFQTGKYSYKSLLPQDPSLNEDACMEATNATKCFLAGDDRVNQNQALSSMQTLLVREHNRIATILSNLNPKWSETTVFEETRRIIIAMIQHITYNEYLTIILNPKSLAEYGIIGGNNDEYFYNYDPKVDPRIANDYSAGAGRFGHSTIRSEYSRVNSRYSKAGTNPFMLRHGFSRANMLYDDEQGGLESIVRGLTVDPLMKVDRWFSGEITQHLFETFSSGKPFHFDLVTINIERGRDHGIPSYNAYRQYCNLAPIRTWTDMKKYIDGEVVEVYKSLYRYVDDVDLFTAMVSEIKEPGSFAGPIVNCIVGRQFRDLKHGDRFWYETALEPAAFTPGQLRELRKMTLSRLLCRTMYDTPTVTVNSFFQAKNYTNPIIPCSQLPDLNWELWKVPAY